MPLNARLWLAVLAAHATCIVPAAARPQSLDVQPDGGETICLPVLRLWDGTVDDIRRIESDPVPASYRSGQQSCGGPLRSIDLIGWHDRFGTEASVTAALSFIEQRDARARNEAERNMRGDIARALAAISAEYPQYRAASGPPPSHAPRLPQQIAGNATVGDVLDRLGSLEEDRFFIAGTPEVVADAIERWLDEDGIDGINLRQYLSFETARDFIDLVVPELRRRGRFRQKYEDGETLRERTFGAGKARLPADHIGARYRDPAALGASLPPLRFDQPEPAAPPRALAGVQK